MPRYGSEEFYNTPGFRLSYNQGADQTPELMERATDRRIATQNKMSDDYVENQRRMAETIGNGLKDAVSGYQQGKLRAQQGRANEADLAYKGIQSEEARARMDEQNRLTKFKTAKVNPNDPNSMSREEQTYQNQMDSDILAKQERTAAIQNMALQGRALSTQLGNTQQDRDKADAVSYYQNAIQTGDPNAMSAAHKYADEHHFNAAQKTNFMSEAQKNIASGKVGANLTYSTSLSGQLAGQKLTDANNHITELSKLKKAVEQYDSAYLGASVDQDASIAMSDAEAAVSKMGKNPEMLKQGVGFQGSKLKNAYNALVKEAEVKLEDLKKSAGAEASPEIKGQIQNLEMQLAEMKNQKGSGAFKRSMQQPGTQPRSGTQLTNFLGGAQPQQVNQTQPSPGQQQRRVSPLRQNAIPAE